jgi:RsiW-degrading membrane proteinase PrsW (M82 family)
MVVPGFLIESLFAPLCTSPFEILSALMLSFILIAPVEELLKFFVVKKWIYNQIEFDEIMDGIVYCVASSLGFATVENIFYVFKYGLGTGILRAFLSVPGHAFFGALMGYYLGLAKFNKDAEKKLIFLGILFAVLVHGLYDFLLFTRTILAIFVILLILLLGFLTHGNLKKAEMQSKMRAEQENLLCSEESKND